MTTYLLDANVLITPYRSYYPFDFALSFWDFIAAKAQNCSVLSIDKVKDEILRGGDYLSSWFDNNMNNYCMTTQTSGILQAYQDLVQHVNANITYNQRAKDEFMSVNNADTWLLAYCLDAQRKEKNVTIVTLEIYNPTIKRKVPIPNICKDFEIEYCNCFELLRRLNFSF